MPLEDLLDSMPLAGTKLKPQQPTSKTPKAKANKSRQWHAVDK
jgi:hypothetical protein